MKKRHTGKRKEDYLESIYLLSKEKRIIRIKDIAEKLYVRKSTVVSMVEKLVHEDLLVHEKYSDVYLTEKGIKKAKEVYKKHKTIYSFLKEVLILDKEICEKDACNLEHYMSDITTQKLLTFIDFFLHKINENESLNEEFRKILK